MIILTWKFELHKLLASLLPILVLSSGLDARPNLKDVCLDQGCVLAAADIINAMDEKINPCDDFYQFACNNWQKKEFIPDDKSSVSMFGKLRDDLRLKLRILLESQSNDTQEFMVKSKSFYKSCMNLKLLEKKGDQPLRDVIEKIGGWPVLGNWNESKFDWVDQLIKFRELGLTHDMIFDLSVSQDYKNNTIRKIELDQSDLGMPDRQYMIKGLNDSAVKAYYQLAIDAATLLGAKLETATEELKKAIEFEIKLANYSLAREDRRNFTKLYNLYTIKKLKTIAPNTDWLKYFNGLIGVKVDENEEIIVSVPEFVTRIDTMLLNEDKRVISNYMVWRIVLQSVASLNKSFRDVYFNYQRVINGNNQEPPRWDTCVSRVTEWMGMALSNVYVKHHFDPESKKQAVTLVDYLLKEFQKILKNIDWMDKQTQKRAIEKVEAFKTYIGYPDQLLNDSLINEYYEKLSVNPDEYYKNVFTYNKFITDKSYNKLRELNDKEDWKKHALSATVNAFNYLDDNSIEFPAGILQGNFYNSRRPNYLNFGSIGMVIGHEITHGFDDSGMQFNKYGNSENWWEDSTFRKFKEKAQCIIDQYSNFTHPAAKMHLNGQATQGENIADNGGISQAFGAYRQWVKDNTVELSLPGLTNYTNEQLFFVSFANIWCSNERVEYIKKIILSDEHSPAKFRVNGVLVNSPEFAEAFNCPQNSKMNPSKRCKVW